MAIANGVVTQSTSNASEGNFVDVTHDNGLRTHSIHLNSRVVSANQRVTAGQLLGYSGNTGTASKGPHLHIEVFRNGGRIDPHAFFLQFVGPGKDNTTTPAPEKEEDEDMKPRMVRVNDAASPTLNGLVAFLFPDRAVRTKTSDEIYRLGRAWGILAPGQKWETVIDEVNAVEYAAAETEINANRTLTRSEIVAAIKA